MRPKKYQDFPRYQNTGKKYNFLGPERTRTRNHLKSEDYEYLPIQESMRMYMWRGHNCWTDNCRLGGHGSRRVKMHCFENIARRFDGKEFVELHSYMYRTFRTHDVKEVDWFFALKFDNPYMFGCLLANEFSVEAGIVNVKARA